MEQRRLRLGDIVDDYCPRERRVTNHAVVAMIEDDIRQTRCTTCDTEHVYKGGSAPRPRRKHTETVTASPASTADVDGGTNMSGGTNAEEAPVRDVDPEAPTAPGDEPVPSRRPAAATPDEDGPVTRDETGPVRRPLIRATLPRPEGQPTARPAPEFTIRQPGLRGGYPDRGRGARGMGGNGQPFGTRPGKGGGRPGGGASGRFDRGGRPQHGGRPQGGRRSDKKRSR